VKGWIKLLFKRIGDLIIKLISAKTIAALVVTYIALKNPTDSSTLLVTIMWALVVGFRFAEKLIDLFRK
jgi:hypothetical protein